MINYQFLIIYSAYLPPLLLIITGLLFLFKTEWMLTLTTYLERLIGAMWIPSEFTYLLYRLIGILLLSAGSLYLGYVWVR